MLSHSLSASTGRIQVAVTRPRRSDDTYTPAMAVAGPIASRRLADHPVAGFLAASIAFLAALGWCVRRSPRALAICAAIALRRRRPHRGFAPCSSDCLDRRHARAWISPRFPSSPDGRAFVCCSRYRCSASSWRPAGLTGGRLLALSLPVHYTCRRGRGRLMVAMYVGGISGGLITGDLMRIRRAELRGQTARRLPDARGGRRAARSGSASPPC